MKVLNSFLSRASKLVLLALGCALVLLLATLDFYTAHEVALWIFYLIPVATVTWYAGKDCGVFMAFVSSLAWYFADELAGHPLSSLMIPMWNALVQLVGFWLFVRVLARLHEQLDEARRLARSDPLTGALSGRALLDLATVELERVRRYGHPLTLVCFDLDDFKTLNEKHGHEVGDQLLQGVVRTLLGNLRTMDVVARWGGDEFMLLLPETGPEQAQMVVPRVREKLHELMRRNAWPVTISTGVVTFFSCPPPDAAPVDEALRHALELSSTAKAQAKGSIRYDVQGETVTVR